MKRTFLISAIAVAAALLAVSCQKEQEQKPSKKLECTAQESYTVAATAAKSVSFDIAANTPWTITSSENWCKVTPSSSKESSLAETIIVKFEDNTGSASREATLTIEGEGIEKPTLVKFIQGVPGKITITPFTEKFAKEGGKQTFTVLSNKPWAVTASPSDWLTFEPASGEASEQPVTVTATAKYTDGKGHTATVTVTSEDASQSFEASIEGLVFEVEELEEGEKAFDYKGGAKEIKVNANIDWNVAVSDGQFTASKTEGGIKVEAPMSKWFGKKTFSVTVTPVTTIEGVGPVTIDMAIAPHSYIDNNDKSAYKINEDGSVTLTIAEKNEEPTKNQAFMKTFDEYKYGNFVWEFSDVKLTEGYFCVNNWNGPFYLMLKYGYNMALLACGGETSTEPVNASFEEILTAVKGAVPNSDKMVDATSTYLKNFIKANPDDYANFTVQVQSISTAIDEFGLFEAKSVEEAEAIEDMIEAYLDFYENEVWDDRYVAEEFPKLRDAECVRRGQYVFYVILGEDARADAITAFENAAK